MSTPPMTQSQLESLLREWEQKGLACRGETIKVKHDFSAEVTTLGKEPEERVRLSDKHLRHRINKESPHLSREQILELLCDISRNPSRYRDIVLP